MLRPTSCFGATSGKQERVPGSEQQCAHAILTSPAANLAPYELNFQLLVRGACLLAGIACLLKWFRFWVFWRTHGEILEQKYVWGILPESRVIELKNRIQIQTLPEHKVKRSYKYTAGLSLLHKI